MLGNEQCAWKLMVLCFWVCIRRSNASHNHGAGSRVLQTTTCNGKTYVNPSYRQVPHARFSSHSPTGDEEKYGTDDVVVYAHNDREYSSSAYKVFAHDGKAYSGFVSCEVFHDARLSWICTKEG